MQPFRWLLMDEPFSHIDEDNTAIALRLIEEVCARRNAGYIISSLGAEHSGGYDKILEL
jgi:putative ABC transport system ATP-binding protein